MRTLLRAEARPVARSPLIEMRANGAALLLQHALNGAMRKRTLKELLKGVAGARVTGRGNPVIQGISMDSRRVLPGGLFFAVSGRRTEGALYIGEAIDRGAVAVVSEKDCWVPPSVTLVLVADVRAAIASIARSFYGAADAHLQLTGIAGTSGKTVVAELTRHFMEQSGKVGLIGTNQYAIGARTLPAHRTTPEPTELHALFAQMREAGCAKAILEVSSHGIDQRRVENLRFATIALLNLTPEHLDYHGGFERYVERQRNWFISNAATAKAAVCGVDDPAVAAIAAQLKLPGKARLITFGIAAGADVRAEEVVMTAADTRFQLVVDGVRYQCVSPLLGEFNLQNVLAAVACGIGSGLDVGSMVSSLLGFAGVRGRMERIEASRKPAVIVDYMHTPAAYEKGLRMLRGLCRGRLITVFGCGGGRDPRPRSRITRIATELSDVAIATADNPRHEEVQAIFDDMRAGNEACTRLRFIEDRRNAIVEAIRMASPEDTVVIAGKGHEAFQEFADCVVPFDDRIVAREVLAQQHWYSS